jgi:methylmalonyl-CoA/ethylmalonyl-CoA epimerase
MPKIKRIHHVAILVEDLDAPLSFWQTALGLELDHIQEMPSEAARIAFLPTGDSEVELVMPVTGDSGLARYLEKRGPGMHHICLEVDDIQGMIAQLKAQGIQLINEEVQVTAQGRKYAFVHPRSAYGVLVELYEMPGT